MFLIIAKDWVALDLPTYPKIVKKPMDLSTIRKKLDEQQYPTAQKFFDDFKLMIRNCFLFNPGGTPVNQAGIELQRVFDEKWKQLPPLREVVSEDDDEEDEEDSEDERQRELHIYYLLYVNLTLYADSPRRYHRNDGEPDRDDARKYCCTQKHEITEREEEERETRQGACRIFLQSHSQIEQGCYEEKEQEAHL